MIKIPVSNNGWRVKLYQLKEGNGWDDQGTGYLECVFLTTIRAPAFIIRKEDDPSVVFESKIQCEDVYERQGGQRS